MKKNNNCKKAFTLAETLLTLAIIGVVAAMTIPALKDHSDEIRYVASAKKAYSTISAATSALESKNGDLQFWDWDTAGAVATMYRNQMNTIPYDGKKWAAYKLDGSLWTNYGAIPANTIVTTDGMVWSIGKDGKIGAAIVDTNGPQEPNTIGIDLFGFYIWKDGVYAMGGKESKNGEWNCTYKAVVDGQMPWIKDGSITSCK